MTISTKQTPASPAAEFAAVMNPTGATPAVSNVFRPKFGLGKAGAGSTAVAPSVERAVGTADQLAQSYQKLRVDLLDRTDQALWEMLQETYGFTRQVESSVQKNDIRKELIRKIQLRDSQGVASNASIDAVVVRYVFANLSRQTRNNYTIAMEKARALDIPVTGFASFLADHGGVGGVVDTVFDHEAEEQSTAKELAEAKAMEKTTRTQLITRLFAAMAHDSHKELDYAGEVTDWVLPDPKADKPKSTTSAKPDPRYQKGTFVFFVTLRNSETGSFRVAQGNVFDQAYEQQLLASIAERMDVSIPDLSATVQGLERSIGFGALAANDAERLEQA
ncbi:hypothetical protein [Limnohabitans sp. Hippo4]|uniref:hypothetical protein n=1 Tax=Limnohabitans sp. Hippo4 TaxID=1826167 RepID=UPI000D3D71F3|nr:hypothetical protein [Limnohabitans sp. Hippo4]PUE36791.1 hypothetical protein B9Z46_08960 [Limnohabitans sp. Hippo4]